MFMLKLPVLSRAVIDTETNKKKYTTTSDTATNFKCIKHEYFFPSYLINNSIFRTKTSKKEFFC